MTEMYVAAAAAAVDVVEDYEVHMLPDGTYYFEIDALPEEDLDDDNDSELDVEPRKPTKLTFSKEPIKVSHILTCLLYGHFEDIYPGNQVDSITL